MYNARFKSSTYFIVLKTFPKLALGLGFLLLNACSRFNPEVQKVVEAQSQYFNCQQKFNFQSANCLKELDAWIKAENQAKASGIDESTLREAIQEAQKQQQKSL